MTQYTPVLAGCLPGASALKRGTLAWTMLAVLAPSLLAQLQFDELRKRHLPPRLAGSLNLQALALSDVDGDGDADLVLGMFPFPGNSGKNRLYLNDGTGIFTDVTDVRLSQDRGSSTTAMALGDVDGDGDPDLIFGNAPGRTRLYLNDGNGSFTDATAARLPWRGVACA